MKRAQRSETLWREIVAGANASGLTRAKYAEKMGIGQAALSYWLTKLKSEVPKSEKHQKRTSGSLVPVGVVETRPTVGREITLSCGDAVLCFSEGTSVDYVAKLTAALRSC